MVMVNLFNGITFERIVIATSLMGIMFLILTILKNEFRSDRMGIPLHIITISIRYGVETIIELASVVVFTILIPFGVVHQGNINFGVGVLIVLSIALGIFIIFTRFIKMFDKKTTLKSVRSAVFIAGIVVWVLISLSTIILTYVEYLNNNNILIPEQINNILMFVFIITLMYMAGIIAIIIYKIATQLYRESQLEYTCSYNNETYLIGMKYSSDSLIIMPCQIEKKSSIIHYNRGEFLVREKNKLDNITRHNKYELKEMK